VSQLRSSRNNIEQNVRDYADPPVVTIASDLCMECGLTWIEQLKILAALVGVTRGLLKRLSGLTVVIRSQFALSE